MLRFLHRYTLSSPCNTSLFGGKFVKVAFFGVGSLVLFGPTKGRHIRRFSNMMAAFTRSMERALCVIVTVGLLLLLQHQVALAAKATNVPCSNRYACFPYSSNGPFCNRGNRMNMRFSTTITPERIGYDSPFETVTYAFCPIVDELEAFNLTSSLRLAATVADSTDPTLFKYSSVWSGVPDRVWTRRPREHPLPVG